MKKKVLVFLAATLAAFEVAPVMVSAADTDTWAIWQTRTVSF